jgi:hypothetical protein
MNAGERAMSKRDKMTSRQTCSRGPSPAAGGWGGFRLLPLLLGLLVGATLPPAPVLAGAYDQLLQMSGGGASVPDVPPPTCDSNCGNDARQQNVRPQEVPRGGGLSTTQIMTLKTIQDSIDQMFQLKPGAILKIRDQQVQGAEAVQGAILNQQQAEEARRAQAERDAEGARRKELNDLGISLQGMPADTAEDLRSGAGTGFDTAANGRVPTAAPAAAPTPFFGDTMPPADLQTLLNPEGDPRVVDLRQAVTYVVGNLKTNEELARNARQKAAEHDRRNKAKPASCKQIAVKLNNFIEQQNKFQKTILQAQAQVTTWEDENRNALINQVKDGLEYFIGNYLEVLRNRGLAADRLQRIFERNSANMARDGLDVAAIEAKIQRLKALSAAGTLSGGANQADTWQTVLKDGASSLLGPLSASNREIDAMMDDPRMQKYFTADAPELNLLLDISKIAADCKVLGKWVAKKMPMVALMEISIKTLYNATDWFLSYQHILDSNAINGRVMFAAKSLQNHIDDTYLDLKQCEQ